MVGQVRPLQATSGYGYDGGDRVIQVTDPRALVTSYTYDGFGDLIQETSPDRGTTVYRVDAAGNRTRRVDAAGVETDYGWDALNRLSAVSNPATPGANLAFGYDDPTPGVFGVGRLTSVAGNGVGVTYAYDARGNRVQESRTVGGVTAVTAYGFDAADALVSLTYPSGRVVNYARDGQGRVSGVTMQAGAGAPATTLASGISYDPFGPVAGLTLGNGLTASFSRDQNGRLTALAVTGSGGAVRAQSLTTDATGNITAIADPVVPGRSQSFQYDALDRLVAATGAYGSLGYGYDASGNRTGRTFGSGGPPAESYLTPASSNQLASVSNGPSPTLSPGTITSLYDAAGHRVSQQQPAVPGSRTDFLYDPAGQLLAESDGTGVALREYVWLGELPLAMVADSVAGAPTYWIHTDQLGTPQTLTDASATVVWDTTRGPFGEWLTITGAAVMPLRFPGQVFDADSGWHDNHHRSYDPNLGRYLQSDPIGLAGGLNPYDYVGGNPLGYADPSGQCPLCLAAAVLAVTLTPNRPTHRSRETAPSQRTRRPPSSMP